MFATIHLGASVFVPESSARATSELRLKASCFSFQAFRSPYRSLLLRHTAQLKIVAGIYETGVPELTDEKAFSIHIVDDQTIVDTNEIIYCISLWVI